MKYNSLFLSKIMKDVAIFVVCCSRVGALRVNSLHAGYFCMLLLSSADFFKIFFFITVFQEHYQLH